MSNWSAFADSSYPWERDALDYVRERFPDHEPWRAWSLFEFIGLDGSVNEVDLLVFSPWGFFLIEIKSRPGRVTGDAGTWTWETDGRLTSTDNPLKLANLKAKKLRSLLEAHAPARRSSAIPFIEPLVFLSDPRLVNDLTGTGRLRVCLRDRDESRTTDGTPIPARPGGPAVCELGHIVGYKCTCRDAATDVRKAPCAVPVPFGRRYGITPKAASRVRSVH